MRLSKWYSHNHDDINYWQDFTTQYIYVIFIVTKKILLTGFLKLFSFQPSAGVKPMPNDLCKQCPGSACLLSLCVYYVLFGGSHWMEQHIFTILLIIEGTTEKVLQFILALKVNLHKKTFGFLQQNVFLNTKERF